MEPQHFTSFLPRREFFRQAACAALGTGAIRNILHDLRIMNAAVAQTYTSDYKALVCVFLAGGNDSNNWIVPTDTAEYASYASARSNVLAIPSADILRLDAANNANPLNNPGRGFGLHPSCPNLRTLFGQQKLATIFNLGNLAYPITRAQYTANPRVVGIPVQLFSHSDQVNQWQTSIPDRPSTTGWGGRAADLLDATYNGTTTPISLSISLTGANTFEVGNVVAQYTVATSGAINLTLPNSNDPASPDFGFSAGSSPRRQVLRDIASAGALDSVKHLQSREYAKVVKQSIDVGQALNSAILNFRDPTDTFTNAGGTTFSYQNQDASAPWIWNNDLTGNYAPGINGGLGGFPNTTLGLQLKMVARMIAGRAALGMRRQIFFCQVGGYDTHTNQTDVDAGAPLPADAITGTHANLLSEVDRCMYAFQKAMEQLKANATNWAGEPATSGVTAFTASDFGRTFVSNGQGSDHGWGTHQIVVGDAVDGRKTYGVWPTLSINGPDDTGLGRWIPTTAVDQYAAALARWFGVPASDLSTVLPNISRFGAPPALFRAGTFV